MGDEFRMRAYGEVPMPLRWERPSRLAAFAVPRDLARWPEADVFYEAIQRELPGADVLIDRVAPPYYTALSDMRIRVAIEDRDAGQSLAVTHTISALALAQCRGIPPGMAEGIACDIAARFLSKWPDARKFAVLMIVDRATRMAHDTLERETKARRAEREPIARAVVALARKRGRRGVLRLVARAVG